MSTEFELKAKDLSVMADGLEVAPGKNEALNAATEPQDELVLTARNRIVLQCGQSSITLHANGKVVIRGEYILSAAEGTNRLAGGHIELN